ncbi:lysosomal acid phosphatase-like, partial [Oscarella lobularis]|uniref:lysosomal acid phosphatase-like n=1 Tax=Oscarella lobularis TaxID=121494 RepID=UPI003313AC48
RLSVQVFRHGDRSPVGTFPNDSHQVGDWPQGWGQLTQERRHFFSTRRTDERNEIHVRSTDVDRTLMSAECQMAALYKPTGRQVFLENLDWQPVPIHTVPVAENKLLRGYTVDCPCYKELREEGENDAD